MVLVGEGVEVLLLVLDQVLEPLVDRGAAVPDLLQDRLEDDHVPNDGIFQHIDLQQDGRRLRDEPADPGRQLPTWCRTTLVSGIR